MKQYIGTKVVEAEPAKRYENGIEFVIISPGQEISEAEAHVVNSAVTCSEGYRVRYADGYTSWSPKDVFERAYLPVEANQELKTDRPSISQKMVDDFISTVEVLTMGDKTTVVRAVLRNGFEIVEASSCVSKENYDEKLGAEICMRKIRDKTWMLLGFLLQTGVHGI